MAGLTLDRLGKSYGPLPVIHGVSLSIADGEFVVLVGPSGCGKSTLLRMIAGLETISSGELRIDGVRVNELPAAERGLAMVFQSYALYPHMSVRQNMAFGLENAGLPRAEIDRRLAGAVAMLRLQPYLDRRPGALSGGQRQRVAIGRAIVRDPRIFLFDEPLSNLDAELRVAMRKELAALHAGIGGTMIYVTHDQIEAMTLAQRIVVLRAGRIEQVGAPLELYNRPANLFVAGFIGSPHMNQLPAIVAEVGATGLVVACGAMRLALPVPGLELAPGSPVTLGIRPEHLDVRDGGDLEVTVGLCEQLGAGTLIYGTADGLPEITLQRDGQLPARRGDRLGLHLNRDALHLFDRDGRALAHGAVPAPPAA